MLNYIKRQTLKDGQPVKVKIGIHTGNVISGVVGENKPQFSLIGDTVNKTSRVCSKCKDNQILISKEAKKWLLQQSNMYSTERQTVDMKGIGREDVFYIRKRSNPNNVMPSGYGHA
jgi:class 3 adenylate cyclase